MPREQALLIRQQMFRLTAHDYEPKKPDLHEAIRGESLQRQRVRRTRRHKSKLAGGPQEVFAVEINP